MLRVGFLFFLVLSFFYAPFVGATDQSSATYQNVGTTFAPVVKDVSSSNYLMTASIDAIVGLSSSPSYTVRSGVALNEGATSSGSSSSSGSGSGGGGGGGGGSPVPNGTGIDFSGQAYPLSSVFVLKDGQLLMTTVAGQDGRFTVTAAGLQAGSYNFGIYAQDYQTVRSATFSFPISVPTSTIVTVGGIFLAPTLSADKTAVMSGDTLTFSGQSAPLAQITIQVSSMVNATQPFVLSTTADASGLYQFPLNTGVLPLGSYRAVSQAALGTIQSAVSSPVVFDISLTGQAPPSAVCSKADLNCDGRVDLVDFSIAGYWYRRPLSPAFATIEAQRLSGDGKVDLVDFSIMAHYWTG